jgi:Ran GTPase-activating protein (RanGAP) involved in mRNA processing and transport
VNRLTINLNFLFEEDKKNALLDRLSATPNPLKPSIRIFAIEDAVIRDRNLETLFKGMLIQNIQCLKLPRNALGNKGIQTLFHSFTDRVRHIKKLDISSNNIIGEEGGKIIADSKSFLQLFSIDLRMNKLGHEGFRLLIQSKNYPALTDLKLDKNKVEDSGAQQLVQICNMNSLKVLKLRSNEIEPKGVQYLANSYAVRNLVTLDLSSNLILDEGFKYLTTASFLSNLHKLYVNDAGLTSTAAQYLRESKFLAKLRVLSLGKNQMK